jgi:hypothetical protein
MLGMMGDTKESMAKTVELIKKHKINLTKSILICTPRFDTQMYKETVKQLGMEIDSFLKLDSYKGSINNYPLIWIGCQGACELVYDFNKHQWFDISYSPRKRVTNLKSHILRLYEIDIKNYGCDEKGPYLDKDDIKKVQDYYTDIIRIIKSSKIG